MQNRIITLLGAMLLLPSLVLSQQVRVAVGYTDMPGRLGNVQSDHGAALRLGVDLLGGRALTWTIEGGIDRLNEVRVSNPTLPGGGPGSGTFTSRERDTGLSLASIFRLHVGAAAVRPYALAGFGYLRVRTPYEEATFDASGSVVPNLSGAGTLGQDALQGHLGGGLLMQPGRLPFGITVEGRAIGVLYGYSGGLQWSWSPVVLVGVRIGG